MSPSYNRRLDRLERREARMLRAGQSPRLGVTAQLEQKVPPKLRQTLEAAFDKAFLLLFEQGGRLLERTFDREKLQADYLRCSAALEGEGGDQALAKLSRSAGTSAVLNTGLAAVEGGLLGLLGIGLPDIPILLGLLLKTLYQNALRCGFDYTAPQERYYQLLLLAGALSQGEEQNEYARRIDEAARHFDHGWPLVYNLEEQTRATAAVLSSALLTAKFIQGLPIVGLVGGVANFTATRKVTTFATLKYEKRFLEHKRRVRNEQTLLPR